MRHLIFTTLAYTCTLAVQQTFYLNDYFVYGGPQVQCSSAMHIAALTSNYLLLCRAFFCSAAVFYCSAEHFPSPQDTEFRLGALESASFTCIFYYSGSFLACKISSPVQIGAVNIIPQHTHPPQSVRTLLSVTHITTFLKTPFASLFF